MLSTATSVGYALSQAMGWVVVTHLALKRNHAGYEANAAPQFGWMLLTGFLVTAFGTPLQLLSGYLIGLEVTRDAWHWWSYALLVPAAIRSAYYISAIGLLVLLDEVFGALALWFLVNLGLCYAMAVRVRVVEAAMPAPYLARVGYLRWGVAYGVLEAHDDDGDDGTGIQAGVQDAESLPSQRRQQRQRTEGSASKSSGGSSNGGDVEMRANANKSSGGGSGGAPAAAARAAAASAPKPVATRDSVMARLNAMKAANAAKAAGAPGAATAAAPVALAPPRSGGAVPVGGGFGFDEVHNPMAGGQFEYEDGDEIAIL
jgi:hypothetical protein